VGRPPTAAPIEQAAGKLVVIAVAPTADLLPAGIGAEHGHRALPYRRGSLVATLDHIGHTGG
jgi:hypothetical protein